MYVPGMEARKRAALFLVVQNRRKDKARRVSINLGGPGQDADDTRKGKFELIGAIVVDSCKFIACAVQCMLMYFFLVDSLVCEKRVIVMTTLYGLSKNDYASFFSFYPIRMCRLVSLLRPTCYLGTLLLGGPLPSAY